MSLCWILIDGFSLFLIIWLSFVCCCQGYGSGCGAVVHLWMCRYLCVCACIGAFVCTRISFMINKQLFSTKIFQLLIKSLVVKLRWEFRRWISVPQPTFVDLAPVSHSILLQKARCLLLLTTVTPSENGPTSNEESKINPMSVLCDLVLYSLSEHLPYLQLIQVWLRGALRFFSNITPLTAIVFPSA